MADAERPKIEVLKSGALCVRNLNKLVDSEGNLLPVKPMMLLCRCGNSRRKPFCDGAHVKKGFTGEKLTDVSKKDRVVSYRGKRITVGDNRAVCSRDGSCYRESPEVFLPAKFKWVKPDAAPIEEIIETIKQCPSGSLSYKIDGEWVKEWESEPLIKVAKNGPFEVKGGIELVDETGARPETRDHYTLCRCGQSKNMPFCDGSHVGHFDDEPVEE